MYFTEWLHRGTRLCHRGNLYLEWRVIQCLCLNWEDSVGRNTACRHSCWHQWLGLHHLWWHLDWVCKYQQVRWLWMRTFIIPCLQIAGHLFVRGRTMSSWVHWRWQLQLLILLCAAKLARDHHQQPGQNLWTLATAIMFKQLLYQGQMRRHIVVHLPG